MREFLAQFRDHFLSAAVFSLVINMLMLAPALFMLQVFDRVVSSRSVETLVMLFVLTLMALVVMAYLDAIRTRLLARAAMKLERLLGPRILSSMLRQSARSNRAQSLHGLRDINALRNFLTGPGVVAVFDAPWVPLFIALIFLFHPLLGAVALGGALLLVSLTVLNERLARRSIEAMQTDARLAARFVDQSLGNAEVVGALGMVDNVTQDWSEKSQKVLQSQFEANQIGSFLTSTTRFLRQMLQVVMLAAGAWLTIEQLSTPGVMIAATIILGRALAPIESLTAGWKSLVEARSAYQRLAKVIESEPNEPAAMKLPSPKGALSVENLLFGFRGQELPVIRRVSFALAPGESLAIIGPSAAGKSTLARLLVGVWHPISGAVRLDGADIRSWPRERLGPHIGYLPQDVEIFAGTVAENIARLGEVESAEVIKAATRANAHEMVLALPQGYDTPVGEGGMLLSAGQRQRLALARALYGNPRLVVLDEPNSNLDTRGEAALADCIRLLKAEGVTLVAITHRLPLVSAVDKVMVLMHGAIQKFGTLAEVLPRTTRAPDPAHNVVAGKIGPRA
ncbi:MAG TPA: type I secretion system permease/ATPase [Burkholderiales bacterium]|jgi:PrtD family type I secretion system ABC transporter|nr:type I secretion system permease/ATPase [Burkholderiales bacterium]